MAAFQYTGLDIQGRSITGTIDAPTEQGALEKLTAEDIVPISLEPGNAATSEAEKKATRWFGSGRVTAAKKALFVRELATFIHADIPLLEALGVMRRQEANPAFRTILDDVYDRVQGGDSFSKALSVHPKVFPPLLTSMIRVGETGGVLGQVLDQMAEWMEHEEEVRDEIRGAMAYPLMVLCLGFVTVIILVSFVLPRIASLFAGMEGELPLPTRMLMGTAGFMGQWWWAVLLGGAALAVAIRWFARSDRGKEAIDRATVSVPIFGPMFQKSTIARFARSCAVLLSAGVPLLEALYVVRGLLGNFLMVAMVDHAIDRVTRGQSLARALGESPYFPPNALHLLGVGERTGRLGEMFDRVAEVFERQSRTYIKVLLNLLAPLMIILLAVLVAMIAISILLPIFKMNQLVR